MEQLPEGCLILVTLCALLQLFFIRQTAATCNTMSGPSGLVECINLYPYYQKSQWTTCLTDAYIKQKSKGKHQCIDRTAKYCLYQCMLEIYNVEISYNTPSPVYDDCACANGVQQTTQQSIPTSTLPASCFSPDGQDCSWYSDCLEKRHHCEGTAGAYAIKYADKFCNLYSDHYASFSQIGQNWIDAVRKCLQMVLVPVLRPWVNITCDGIRQMALRSHANCYLSPYPGAPSFCDLPCTDWWNVFWTIKSAFLSPNVDTLQSGLDLINGCSFNWSNPEKLLKFIFNISRESSKRNKRSASETLDDLAGAVADAMGSKLRWTDAGVMWYAYSNSSTSSDTIPMYVLITGKSTYNLNNIQGTNVNLTDVKERVMKAVRDGDLSFSNIGKGSEPIYVKQMKECIDFACLKTTNNVTAPEKIVTKSSASEQMGHCLQITYPLLLILIIVAL